ncbi:hypothetical protein STENM327S_04011 [Streptomyces tendae]
MGRKKIKVFTLVLMGVSTFLIGCLPTRDQVGTLARPCWCCAVSFRAYRRPASRPAPTP